MCAPLHHRCPRRSFSIHTPLAVVIPHPKIPLIPVAIPAAMDLDRQRNETCPPRYLLRPGFAAPAVVPSFSFPPDRSASLVPLYPRHSLFAPPTIFSPCLFDFKPPKPYALLIHASHRRPRTKTSVTDIQAKIQRHKALLHLDSYLLDTDSASRINSCLVLCFSFLPCRSFSFSTIITSSSSLPSSPSPSLRT